MRHVRLSQANNPHLRPPHFWPPAPPPPIAAAESRPYSHLQHLLPSNPTDFFPLLKTCASLCLISFGQILHQRAVVLGLSAEPRLATSLLHLYAANGHISDARKMFDEMPLRNVVPYSALISAYGRSADMNMAFSIYSMMLKDGIRPNSVTLLGFLSGVSELTQMQCLHALAIHLGFEEDLVVLNSMINAYSLCGRADHSRALFDSMPFRDTVSWNSMIAGYSRNGDPKSSANLMHKMKLAGFFPDKQTYMSLLCANNTSCSIRIGSLVHALIVISGLETDSRLITALISMYLRSGESDAASTLFLDPSLEKDAVLWTAMISGLARNDRANESLLLFDQMLRSSPLMTPLNTTIASAVSACAQLGMLRIGASIHCFVMRRRLSLDAAVQNSLITLYMKCGHWNRGQSLFESMQDRDLVSWNAILSGSAHNGRIKEAFHFFIRMISEFQRPDSIAVASILQVCASLGALREGKLIHSFVVRHDLNNSCLLMKTALVDMYSKCGDIERAKKCFDEMIERDVVSWSAIISGYGVHGMGSAALRMYSEFLSTKMEPNNVMLLSVLAACSHSGLVSEGLAIFNSMKKDFSIEPWIQHCACIVDLLCRAGNIEKAFEFYRKKVSMPNSDILGIILDACREGGAASVAEEVVKEMIKLMPESAGCYVQLAHNYAAMKCWDGVGEALRKMRALGLKKTPGWSFVEVNGVKNAFFADDASHPKTDEVLWLLKHLKNEMREKESYDLLQTC